MMLILLLYFRLFMRILLLTPCCRCRPYALPPLRFYAMLITIAIRYKRHTLRQPMPRRLRRATPHTPLYMPLFRDVTLMMPVAVAVTYRHVTA